MADYVLIGEKLGHSYSPRIHALLGGYDYQLVELAPDELEGYLLARPFRGANVTIPYKRAAYALCDRLSAEARALGNVNTLVVDGGGALVGHNTDMAGFLFMARRAGIRVEGRSAAVLGGGGAGLTARAGLLRMGAREVSIVSRGGPVDYNALYRDHDDVQLLVNATPVGMVPRAGASPVDLARLPRVKGVLDLIYNPHRTALCMDAEARGIAWESGLSMLVAQAARASELFTGGMISRDRIADVLRQMRRESLNLVLIGMPGSGKSRIGRAAAALLGREFADIDEGIERRAGLPIPAIFAQWGEPRFRELESEVCRELGARRSLVIAAGGGAVLRPDNVRALRQNGELGWVQRPVDQLATDGRPLSLGVEALRAMERERSPLYRSAASYMIHNQGTIERAAQSAVEGFYEAVGD